MNDATEGTGRSPGGCRGSLSRQLLAGGALGLLLVSSAQAQPPAPAAKPVIMGDPARRDVRVPDTVPNISGTWQSISSNRNIVPLDGGATPFQPWAQAYFDTRAKAEAAGTPLFDPNASCLPSGVPRVLPVPYPLDIVQTPDVIMISIEVMHSFRIIHMDGKPMPATFKPSYLGYSVGHWDGDTLVIETTGMNGYTQTDEEGRPKSMGIKVTERIHKVAPNVLENTFTIDDPKTYTRPWTSRARFTWAPTVRLNEYICEENNRNKPDASGKLRHGQGGRYATHDAAK
jgi:hypothetical protein